jgi:cation diffusion facilitator family transporter
MKDYRKIFRILWLILAANIFVGVVKIILAFSFRSSSLLADGYHALVDSSSNIIGLVGIKLASKPADEEHPYGYHKFETIATMIIGMILFLICGQIVVKAVNCFLKPQTTEISVFGMVMLFGTLLVNTIIAYSEYRQGKKLQSEVLIADSLHTRSDIAISLGVIISLIAIKLGAPSIIDPIVSLGIAVLILFSCIRILKDTIRVLADKKAVDVEVISRIIYEAASDIIDVHKIRSRYRGESIIIDLHLIVRPDKTVKEAHDLNHQLESILSESFCRKVELLAHIEPNER